MVGAVGIRQVAAGLDPALQWASLVSSAIPRVTLATVDVFVRAPGAHTPLILYGQDGPTLTHALHAIGNRLIQADPFMPLRCQRGDEFLDLWQRLTRYGVRTPFRTFLDLDAALTDGIQQFAGDKSWEEIFFLTMGVLAEQGRWVAVTCDRHPLEIPWASPFAFQFIAAGTVVPVGT